MSGIIFFLILAVWFFVAKNLAVLFCSVFNLPKGNVKRVITGGVFILILIFPIVDEVVGWFQFNTLCTTENTLLYDKDKVYGKSVVRRDTPLSTGWPVSTERTNSKRKGIAMYTLHKAIPIVVTTAQWEDSETGELLITYKFLQAEGGWLSHLVGFPQGAPPYIFDGRCSSKEYYELFNKLNVNRISDK